MTFTKEDLTVRVGDTSAELTPREASLGIVGYFYQVPGAPGMVRRFATAEEVVQMDDDVARTAFQVNEGGLAMMRAKANRILTLRTRDAAKESSS